MRPGEQGGYSEEKLEWADAASQKADRATHYSSAVIVRKDWQRPRANGTRRNFRSGGGERQRLGLERVGGAYISGRNQLGSNLNWHFPPIPVSATMRFHLTDKTLHRTSDQNKRIIGIR